MSTATPAPINASRAALLVMDFQAGILARLPDPDGPVAAAARAIAAARAAGATVGYVRVAFADAAEVNPLIAARYGGPEVALEHFGADAPATQIDPRLAPGAGDISVRKTRYGAFSTTDLHEQLQAQSIDTLVLAGISTSGVTLSTLRDANDRDYRVLVLSDACADARPEAHQALTEIIFPATAEVITSAQFAQSLG